MYNSATNLSLEEIQTTIAQEADKFLGSNRSEVKSKSSAAQPIGYKQVINEILQALEPIDFYKLADLEPGQKLTQKHIVVLTVKEVLRVAKKIKCDLCRNADFFYTYTGKYWERLEREQLEHLLGKGAERLGVDHVTASYHKFREELFKQFVAVANLPNPPASKEITLINLENGTFEAHPDKFLVREFRRDDFLTYQLPFGYDKNATYPKWQAFLDEVLPDKDKQKVLAEFFAYVFTKLKLEKTLLLLGTGANGKSVVFEILKALFGEENISHYSLHSLQREYYRAMIGNKLLNYASEISTRLESDVFKKLSSGEPCEARLPYGKPFLVRDYARLAFNCNELPRDVEHTNAFFRRFLIVKFDVTIPKGRRNSKLPDEIIATELSGVFNWLLEGLQRLPKQENFTECQAIDAALEEYRRNSDSVALFIEEMSYKQVSSRDKATLLRVIYGDYKTFCQDYNFRPVSIQTLGNRLRALDMECLRTNKGVLVMTRKAPETLQVLESPVETFQGLPF